MAAPSPIEFYFDFISPYAYFASTKIEALAKRYGREVEWKPVLIGVTIMKIMGMKPLMETPLKSDYLRHDGPRVAKLLGVPFKAKLIKGASSLTAQRAYVWIRAKDPALAARFAHAVFARRWAEGLDITQAADVVEVAAPLGIDPDRLLAAVASDEVKALLQQAVDAAIAKGVFGVPYFIVDGEPIWGSDRLWMLEHWLAHGTWEPASNPPSPPRP